MKSFRKTFLNALDRIEEEPKEFEITVIARPKRRFGKVENKSLIIKGLNKFDALNKARQKFGNNKIVSIKEKGTLRTDNFKTIM